MAYRFNCPPGWPEPPNGWTPPVGWTPDAAWPAAPEDWNFWTTEESEGPRSAGTVLPPAMTAENDRGFLHRKTTTSYGRAAVVTAGALMFGVAVGAGGANSSGAGTMTPAASGKPSDSASLTAEPTVTVTSAPSPVPTVTVTSAPPPVPTVTLTAEPVPAPTVTVTKTPRASPAPFVAPVPQETGSTVDYENCSAARAAGAAPLRRGEPGYRSGLDRDNDGVACE